MQRQLTIKTLQGKKFTIDVIDTAKVSEDNARDRMAGAWEGREFDHIMSKVIDANCQLPTA